jgi:hypothetical protein
VGHRAEESNIGLDRLRICFATVLSPSLPPLRTSLALSLLALAACGLYLLAEWGALVAAGTPGLGFPLDDSWIHVAFAENMADGAGLSLNPGEPVTGSTAPLWTALVAVLATFTDDPDALVLPMKLLGLLFHLAGVFLTWTVGRRLGLSPALATVAAALVAVANQAIWSALSGMEIPLFVALSLAGILLHLDEREELRDGGRTGRAPAALAVLALSTLARPEGALLVLAAAIDRLLVFGRHPETDAVTLEWPGRDRWRSLAAALVPAALVLLPVFAVYMWIWGSPLPTTYAAKAGAGGSTGLHLPDGRYLSTVLGILFGSQPWATLAAGGGVAVLMARLGKHEGRGLLPALWLLGLPLAYSMITPPGGSPLVGNFGRYVYPLGPMVVILGVLGLAAAARALSVDRRRPLLLAVALVVLFAPTVSALVRGAGFFGRNVSDIYRGDVTMAKELARELPPEAVVATMDIGAMGTFLPNRIVDLAAIADPEVRGHIARAQKAGGTWRDGVWAFVAERRPDYLMIFPSWLDPGSAPPEILDRLQPLKHIHVEGNVTLGGGDLLLIATPWAERPLPAVYRTERTNPEPTLPGAAP